MSSGLYLFIVVLFVVVALALAFAIVEFLRVQRENRRAELAQYRASRQQMFEEVIEGLSVRPGQTEQAGQATLYDRPAYQGSESFGSPPLRADSTSESGTQQRPRTVPPGQETPASPVVSSGRWLHDLVAQHDRRAQAHTHIGPDGGYAALGRVLVWAVPRPGRGWTATPGAALVVDVVEGGEEGGFLVVEGVRR